MTYSAIIQSTARQAIKLANSRKSAAQRRSDLDGSLKTAALTLGLAWNKDPHKILKALEQAATTV